MEVYITPGIKPGAFLEPLGRIFWKSSLAFFFLRMWTVPIINRFLKRVPSHSGSFSEWPSLIINPNTFFLLHILPWQFNKTCLLRALGAIVIALISGDFPRFFWKEPIQKRILSLVMNMTFSHLSPSRKVFQVLYSFTFLWVFSIWGVTWSLPFAAIVQVYVLTDLDFYQRKSGGLRFLPGVSAFSLVARRTPLSFFSSRASARQSLLFWSLAPCLISKSSSWWNIIQSTLSSGNSWASWQLFCFILEHDGGDAMIHFIILARVICSWPLSAAIWQSSVIGINLHYSYQSISLWSFSLLLALVQFIPIKKSTLTAIWKVVGLDEHILFTVTTLLDRVAWQ